MKWEEGKTIAFKGCHWDAGWEFDKPHVVYEPVGLYGFTSILSLVEDALELLCVNGSIPDGFHDGDINEFEWRGWNYTRFAQRKAAVHETIVVKLVFDKDGERSFEYAETALAGK